MIDGLYLRIVSHEDLCRTYSNRSVVIRASAIQVSFTVAGVKPPDYRAGMMDPLIDDLALSGAGIDTNSGTS